MQKGEHSCTYDTKSVPCVEQLLWHKNIGFNGHY